MKILYGLCGEGFGHSSRAGVVGDYLTAAGHELKMVTYGQALDVLKDRFDIIPVEGLHLIFEDSVLSKRKTLTYNARHFPKNLGTLEAVPSAHERLCSGPVRFGHGADRADPVERL